MRPRRVLAALSRRAARLGEHQEQQRALPHLAALGDAPMIHSAAHGPVVSAADALRIVRACDGLSLSPGTWRGLKALALSQLGTMRPASALAVLHVLARHRACGVVEARRLQDHLAPVAAALTVKQAVALCAATARTGAPLSPALQPVVHKLLVRHSGRVPLGLLWAFAEASLVHFPGDPLLAAALAQRCLQLPELPPAPEARLLLFAVTRGAGGDRAQDRPQGQTHVPAKGLELVWAWRTVLLDDAVGTWAARDVTLAAATCSALVPCAASTSLDLATLLGNVCLCVLDAAGRHGATAGISSNLLPQIPAPTAAVLLAHLSQCAPIAREAPGVAADYTAAVEILCARLLLGSLPDTRGTPLRAVRRGVQNSRVTPHRGPRADSSHTLDEQTAVAVATALSVLQQLCAPAQGHEEAPDVQTFAAAGAQLLRMRMQPVFAAAPFDGLAPLAAAVAKVGALSLAGTKVLLRRLDNPAVGPLAVHRALAVVSAAVASPTGVRLDPPAAADFLRLAASAADIVSPGASPAHTVARLYLATKAAAHPLEALPAPVRPPAKADAAKLTAQLHALHSRHAPPRDPQGRPLSRLEIRKEERRLQLLIAEAAAAPRDAAPAPAPTLRLPPPAPAAVRGVVSRVAAAAADVTADECYAVLSCAAPFFDAGTTAAAGKGGDAQPRAAGELLWHRSIHDSPTAATGTVGAEARPAIGAHRAASLMALAPLCGCSRSAAAVGPDLLSAWAAGSPSPGAVVKLLEGYRYLALPGTTAALRLKAIVLASGFAVGLEAEAVCSLACSLLALGVAHPPLWDDVVAGLAKAAPVLSVDGLACLAEWGAATAADGGVRPRIADAVGLAVSAKVTALLEDSGAQGPRGVDELRLLRLACAAIDLGLPHEVWLPAAAALRPPCPAAVHDPRAALVVFGAASPLQADGANVGYSALLWRESVRRLNKLSVHACGTVAAHRAVLQVAAAVKGGARSASLDGLLLKLQLLSEEAAAGMSAAHAAPSQYARQRARDAARDIAVVHARPTPLLRPWAATVLSTALRGGPRPQGAAAVASCLQDPRMGAALSAPQLQDLTAFFEDPAQRSTFGQLQCDAVLVSLRAAAAAKAV